MLTDPINIKEDNYFGSYQVVKSVGARADGPGGNPIEFRHEQRNYVLAQTYPDSIRSTIQSEKGTRYAY